MEVGLGRFDYASFLIECDEMEMQAMWLPEWNTCLVNRLPETVRKRHTRVHALGATKGGRRRYIFSVSSEFAENIRYLPFAKWADQLTRVDIRSIIYQCRPDTYEKLCLALECAETRNNIETFKVAARTKTHARDTGGRGVRYGSRKSDLSTKVYKRGSELPALETQFQDDKLDAAVLMALEESLSLESDEFSWITLRSHLSMMQERHMSNWLFQAKINKGLDGLRHEDIPMPEAIRQMYQLEMWGEPRPGPENDKNASEYDAEDYMPFV